MQTDSDLAFVKYTENLPKEKKTYLTDTINYWRWRESIRDYLPKSLVKDLDPKKE